MAVVSIAPAIAHFVRRREENASGAYYSAGGVSRFWAKKKPRTGRGSYQGGMPTE